MICFSVHSCFVEVDIESGEFEIQKYITCEDVGTIINPQIVEGQFKGGIVQGISNCLFEEFLYDDSGQQLTSSLESYQIATAADVPDIKVTHLGVPCPHTPLGSRGIGEGIPGPVPGAITNALCNALEPLGVELNSLPIRPERVWRAIQQANDKT